MENLRFNKRYRAIKRRSDDMIKMGAPTPEELEEFFRKMDTRKSIPVQRRIKEAETFVAMIMEFCDIFEYDMEISRNKDEISATMKIEVVVLSGYCKEFFFAFSKWQMKSTYFRISKTRIFLLYDITPMRYILTERKHAI